MTIEVVVPNSGENRYPRRGDRVNEEPTAKNAQGLFLPDACVFVGNLSTKVSAEDLAEDLKYSFRNLGPCHIKIKQDKKKGLPGAFVQFEEVRNALDALAWDECTVLHERWLRIEKAKGRRTACLGLRSGASISQIDVTTALSGRGPLEVYCLEPFSTGPYSWTIICKVTFAYVDDCRDAIKHFQKDDTYYMVLLDIDGNPFMSGAQRTGPPPKQRKNHTRAALPASKDKDKVQPKNSNGRPHRNGPNNQRAGQRQPLLQDHAPPPAAYNGNPYPPEPCQVSPPFMYNGMPVYATENQAPPPPYFPTPFHPGNGYPAPPMIPASQPGYNSPMVPPHAPPPPPPNNMGPLIVNSQPALMMNHQAFYPETPYYAPDMNMPHPDMGYYGPPPPPPTSMASMPYMYGPPPPPPFYGEPYQPPFPPPTTTVYLNPAYQEENTKQHEVRAAGKANGKVKEANGDEKERKNEQSSPELKQANGKEEDVLVEENGNAEAVQSEKAPNLIQVNGEDSKDEHSNAEKKDDKEEEAKEEKTKPKKTRRFIRIGRLIRRRDDSDSDSEGEGKKEPEKAPCLIRIRDDSDSDSGTSEGSDSDDDDYSSKSSWKERFTLLKRVQEEDEVVEDMTQNFGKEEEEEEEGNQNRGNGNTNTTTSQESSPRRKTLESKYQPSAGIKVEEYVRREAVRLSSDLGEEAILDVITELEEERRQKYKLKQNEKLGLEGTGSEEERETESDTESPENSRSCSLTRTCSSRSI